MYVNLTATGAVTVYALGEHGARLPALLIIPWVNLILGWSYLVNDQKISAIGQYLRRDFGLRILEFVNAAPETLKALHWNLPPSLCEHPVLFGWEVMHRRDPDRESRKTVQLWIDEITFTAPGFVALFAFEFGTRFVGVRDSFQAGMPSVIMVFFHLLAAVEGLFMIFLARRIYHGADRAVGAKKHSETRG